MDRELGDHSTPQQPLSCGADEAFTQWLATSGGSLAVSTYQAGKLLLIGWNGRQISLLPRDFDKPMGLDLHNGRLLLATRYGITMFSDDPVLARHFDIKRPDRYDALYFPRTSWHTADINTHDLALTADNHWLCNTRFSCLARLSERYSFEPVWKPHFVSDLAPEDRCHLNGLALVDGRPGYVTCLGESDEAGGWRGNKARGGVLIEVESQRIILRGLAMPHSPRWHQGQLYLLNSGAGQLLRVDPRNGQSEIIIELDGYLRGLSFVGDTALVGLCKIRESKIFGGMPVEERYDSLRCGISLIDLGTGRETGHFGTTAGCTEIYDLRFLAGRQRPNVLNLDREETRQAMSAPDLHYWLRPEFEIVGR